MDKIRWVKWVSLVLLIFMSTTQPSFISLQSYLSTSCPLICLSISFCQLHLFLLNSFVCFIHLFVSLSEYSAFSPTKEFIFLVVKLVFIINEKFFGGFKSIQQRKKCTSTLFILIWFLCFIPLDILLQFIVEFLSKEWQW